MKRIKINQRERERERDKNTAEIQQLRSEIQSLEAITNKTASQEQELKSKREQLAKLEKQNQEQGNNKGRNYLPWIIGGGLLIVVIIAVVYFLNKNKQKE